MPEVGLMERASHMRASHMREHMWLHALFCVCVFFVAHIRLHIIQRLRETNTIIRISNKLIFDPLLWLIWYNATIYH